MLKRGARGGASPIAPVIASSRPGKLAGKDFAMTDHAYKVVEIVGSSSKSIEEAIDNALARAAKTLENLRWFEVTDTRGHVENGRVAHYQVTLKIGFTLND